MKQENRKLKKNGGNHVPMNTAELRTRRRRIQSMTEEKNNQSVSEEESEHLSV